MMEDHKTQHLPRKSSKSSSTTTKQSSRASKRTSSSHDHGPMTMDGRHKRVWKACERCRMKKTKCDGESPCKRCKDDGLVCTAGSRKKTEFKQLPRGYAEVLENTQYALIATVHKLYTMVRNNDSWELGEPELNERGQPVIHDIASRLGCIRPSPDLPYAFPEGAEDFAELQAQLQANRPEHHSEEAGHALSQDSGDSPALERTDRASSSESDHSIVSKEYNQMIWAQRQVAAAKAVATKPNGLPLTIAAQRPTTSCEEETASYSTRPSLDTTTSTRSMPSPVYTDLQMESPMLRTGSPFSPWTANDDFLGPAHALDLTAHYMRAQQQIQGLPTQQPQSYATTRALGTGLEQNMLKAMQFSDGMNFAEGTIRPNMLDCNTGMEMFDQMDVLYPSADYEAQMGMA